MKILFPIIFRSLIKISRIYFTKFLSGLVAVIAKVTHDFISFTVYSIEWLKYVSPACFSYYLAVVSLLEKHFFLKKDTLSFEILRMNIFIIETALFWSRVSTKPPSAPSESLFQMEFKQRLKIEKFSFQYGLFSLKTNLTKVNIKQIPTTGRSRGDYLH